MYKRQASGSRRAPGTHEAEVDGARFAVDVYPMGASSTSRGSLITLSRKEEAV